MLEIKQNLKKYWIFILIVGIIIFIAIPFNILISMQNIESTQDYFIQQGQEQNDEIIIQLGEQYAKSAIAEKMFSRLNIPILLVFPVIIAMLLSSKKNIYNYISQIILIAIPYIINTIILSIMKLCGGFFDNIIASNIIGWVIVNILVGILICSIANLATSLVKNKVGQVATAYSILYVPVVIMFLFIVLLQELIVGFVTTTLDSIMLELLGLKIFALFNYNYSTNTYLSNFGIAQIITYIVTSIIMFDLAYKLQQKKCNIIKTALKILLILVIPIIIIILLITNITKHHIPYKYDESLITKEYIEQRYSYIVNDKCEEITIYGVYSDIAFSIEATKEDELFTKITTAVKEDIEENHVYNLKPDEYGIYGEKEGIQHLEIDIATEKYVIQEYLTYAMLNENYMLVKLIEELIEKEDSKINWSQE